MPPKRCGGDPHDTLRRSSGQKRSSDPDSKEGMTVISGWGQQLTVDWSQLGTPFGYQDVGELSEAVRDELKAELPDVQDDTALILLPFGSDEQLDPADTLVGDDGKATRILIKQSSEIFVLAADRQYRRREQGPEKPAYHKYGIESFPVSSKTFSDVRNPKLIVNTDDKAKEYDVEYAHFRIGSQPEWIPLDPKNVDVERNQMTYLTLRGLPPTSSVRIRIRGVGINKKSAWGQAQSVFRIAERRAMAPRQQPRVQPRPVPAPVAAPVAVAPPAAPPAAAPPVAAPVAVPAATGLSIPGRIGNIITQLEMDAGLRHNRSTVELAYKKAYPGKEPGNGTLIGLINEIEELFQ